MTASVLRARLESPAAFAAAVGLYGLALALGLKRFLVWDQILALEDAGLWGVFSSLHPHALRWLLLTPTLAFARFGHDPHLVFTVLCLLLLVATALLLARAGTRILGDAAREPALRVWCFLPLAVLSLTMNGRLIPAFAGLALLIALHVDRATGVRRDLGWFIAGQGVALLLLSVASGTFAVGACACAASWAGVVAGHRRDPRVLAAVAGGVLALAAGCLFLARKALRFFDGDPLQVLAHGAGSLVEPFGRGVTVAVCLTVVALAILGTWAWRHPARAGIHLRVPIAASAVLGLLGWSTLVACVPAIVLLAALPLVRKPK